MTTTTSATPHSLRDFATESSERILSVVDSLTRRFDTLVSDKAKYEFVDRVHNALLHDYAMACSHHGSDSVASFVARANSLQHVIDTLFEWSLKPKYIFAYQPGDGGDSDQSGGGAGGTLRGRMTTNLKSRFNVGRRMLRGFGLGGGGTSTSNDATAQPSVNSISGGVFARVITQIRKLLNDEMTREIDHLITAVRDVAGPLENKTWISGGLQQQEDLSPEMCSCLTVIKEHVARWTRALHPALRRRLAMDASRVLQEFLFQVSVLDSIAFSHAGAMQLARDCSALFALFASFDKSPSTTFFPRLHEATRILCFDAKKLKDLESTAFEGESTVLSRPVVEEVCRKRRDVFSDFY
jgi:hypothetical protein